jgi:hypothetical protein
MKRMVLCFLCVLLAGSAFADPVDPSQKVVPKPAADLILYELPAGMPAGKHELEVTFTLRGETQVAERLSFETVQGQKARVVELLAWHPQERAKVLKLARDPRNDVKVTVSLDGKDRVLALSRLLHRTLEVTRTAFLPINTRWVERDPGEGLGVVAAATQQECFDECWNRWDECQRGCWDYACIQECDYWEVECRRGCPPDCVDPKDVDEYDVTQLTGINSYGWTCYEVPWEADFWDGEYYELRWYSYRTTRYRRTEYCDGTSSTVVVSVSNWGEYCNYPTYATCFLPNSRVSNVCR